MEARRRLTQAAAETLRLIAGSSSRPPRILLDGGDVFDNVAFGLRYAKATKAELRTRVGAALDLVSMTSFASRLAPLAS